MVWGRKLVLSKIVEVNYCMANWYSEGKSRCGGKSIKSRGESIFSVIKSWEEIDVALINIPHQCHGSVPAVQIPRILLGICNRRNLSLFDCCFHINWEKKQIKAHIKVLFRFPWITFNTWLEKIEICQKKRNSLAHERTQSRRSSL